MSTVVPIHTVNSEYPFDLGKCWVCDVEVFPGRWCVGFAGVARDGSSKTRIIDRNRDRLAEVLRWFGDHNNILVTYNGDHFDVPVIRAILKGLDPYAIAQGIIRDNLPISLSALPPLGCHHIDLAARLRRGGGFPGLKKVAAYMGRPTLRELPYAPGSVLTDEEWDNVKAYNVVDLGHTRALLERFSPELQALAAISEEQGRDLRSTPTPRVVERVFLDAFKRQHRGTEPSLPQPPQEVIYRGVAGVVRPQTPDAAAWYDSVVDQPISMIGQGDRRRPDVPRAKFKIGRLDVSIGSGGLHSVDQPGVHYETRKHRLLSLDVASFYPSLIASKSISAKAYGDTGAATYRDILNRRLAVKQQAKTETDATERKRLDDQANGLKLILNSTFGKLGDRYSTLYDPAAFIAVTISGQLMIIDLIERLTAVGVRILSANTDGVFARVRRKNQRWRKVVAEWQRDTEMTLEVDPLKRLAILASNRFAVLDRSGKIKRKGAGVKGNLSPNASPNNLIVADAVVAALLEDVPPEQTIRACADPVRFCSVTQRTGKVTAAVLVDESDGSETPLPKISRWYKAAKSARKIEHRFEGGRHTTPANATGVNLALDLVDGELPRDLDTAWYVGAARKVIQGVPGYHHRATKRLQSHPVALDLVQIGLVPAPKYGKALPAGCDRSKPTFLWSWDDFGTFGTYTGPGVGILVIDIDDSLKFKLKVDRGNSPLLENRWRDLDGCLVSYHGEATPADVRSGRARGKLIFRLEGDAAHPLAKLQQSHWLKTHGVEVFYGQGVPSIVGRHPDGSEYRLDGELGNAADWLLEILTPKKRLGGKSSGPDSLIRPQTTPSTNGKHVEPVAVDQATLNGLPMELAVLSTTLGKASVGWRRKDIGDGRIIWVGRCPFEHDSGSSTDGDLSAGYNQDGQPYVRCMHASCTEIPAIDVRLKETCRPRSSLAIEPPPLEPTAIAQSMFDDLTDRLVAVHHAPTGSGKSYSDAQAAVMLYRHGKAVLISVPTLRLAEETLERLREFAPDAFAAHAVAAVCGRRLPPFEDGVDTNADGNDEDGEPSEYPIQKWTRIIVCTHAQIGRRGFSRFLRAIWTKLEASADEDEPRPAFCLIIDEASELIRACRQEIPLAHRVTQKSNPDGSGGRLIPLRYCPKSNRSGNCGNCDRRLVGGEPGFNGFWIRELNLPQSIDVDTEGNELRTPLRPLVVSGGDAQLGPEIKVGTTTFAAELVAWKGTPIDTSTRNTAPLFLFQKGEKGKHPSENPQEILGHMLEFGFRPVVTRERPVNENGEPVDSVLLKYRVEHPSKAAPWDEGIIFPYVTCEVPRLRFADTAGFEMMRRFAQKERVGIVFVGATMTADDTDVLRDTWPKLVERHHPYPARKVRQVATVFLDNHHGVGSLVGDEGKLLTAPLEAFGLGIVFCSTRRVAKSLYDAVKLKHPSVRMAEENDEVTYLKRTLHDFEDLRCYVTYSRGVLGLGANIRDVRFLVVDALAFRAIASFNPAEISPKEFERARADERLALIMQNLGRALRGEEGKTVVLIVLNADQPLREVIKVSPAIAEGSELPPVFGNGEDLIQLVDQARRWLDADGGEWPEADTAKNRTKKGRPPTRSKESVLEAAEAAIAAGTKWREFAQKENVRRVLSSEDMATLKGRFGGVTPDPREPDPDEPY